jgi:hypothetical protein
MTTEQTDHICTIIVVTAVSLFWLVLSAAFFVKIVLVPSGFEPW